MFLFIYANVYLLRFFVVFYAFLLFSLSCLWAKLPESNKCMYVCIRDSPYRSFAVSSNSQLSVDIIFIFLLCQ